MMDPRGEVIMPAAVETKAPEAPSSHQLVLASPTQTANPSQVMGPQGFSTETSGGFPSSLAKKKRGRPRKYGPDGTAVTGRTLSPMPLSASSPTSGGYSDSKLGEFRAEKKKRKMNSAAEKSNMFLGISICSLFAQLILNLPTFYLVESIVELILKCVRT
ncbi:putative AT-hook motif nuclear-localized protein [Helianthus debilis subsp. tardiflorus]